MLEYSVVIPVYNEIESLDTLFEELKTQMDTLQSPYDIIFVNDGSSDGSLEKLRDFQKEFPSLVRLIDLPTRQGQTYALRKGIQEASGRIVVTLDADLQNDPADIPRLLAKFTEGYDVVCGWRKSRRDLPLKISLSKLGNVAQRVFTGMRIHDISCTLRAYKRECVRQLTLDWEGQHRFIPLILSKKGFKVGEIVSNHRQRQFGFSKYSHKRIFRIVTDFFRVLQG